MSKPITTIYKNIARDIMTEKKMKEAETEGTYEINENKKYTIYMKWSYYVRVKILSIVYSCSCCIHNYNVFFSLLVNSSSMFAIIFISHSVEAERLLQSEMKIQTFFQNKNKVINKSNEATIWGKGLEYLVFLLKL